ncbi:hypothetical protein [Thalassotalea montiporae]
MNTSDQTKPVNDSKLVALLNTANNIIGNPIGILTAVIGTITLNMTVLNEQITDVNDASSKLNGVITELTQQVKVLSNLDLEKRLDRIESKLSDVEKQMPLEFRQLSTELSLLKSEIDSHQQAQLSQLNLLTERFIDINNATQNTEHHIANIEQTITRVPRYMAMFSYIYFNLEKHIKPPTPTQIKYSSQLVKDYCLLKSIFFHDIQSPDQMCLDEHLNPQQTQETFSQVR